MHNITRVYVQRMTTSRSDDTKYEYYTTLQNEHGFTMSFHKHFNQEHAVYEIEELALFLGLEAEPLIIDDKRAMPDSVMQSMLDMHREDYAEKLKVAAHEP